MFCKQEEVLTKHVRFFNPRALTYAKTILDLPVHATDDGRAKKYSERNMTKMLICWIPTETNEHPKKPSVPRLHTHDAHAVSGKKSLFDL